MSRMAVKATAIARRIKCFIRTCFPINAIQLISLLMSCIQGGFVCVKIKMI